MRIKITFKSVGVSLILIALVGLTFANSQKGLLVETVKPERMTLLDTIDETGTVHCKNSVTVYSKKTETVKKINFAVGDLVTTKDVLVELDGRSMALQLKDADAKIAAAKASLEGTDLGVLANKMDMAQLALSEAERQVSVLEHTYAQTQALFTAGSTTQESLKSAKDALDGAKNALKTAQTNYKDVSSGVPQYQKKILKAQLEQSLILRSSLLVEKDHLLIRSPLQGIVFERFVDTQSPVTYGTPLFRIGDYKTLEVKVDVLSDDCSLLKINNPVLLTANYLGNTTLKGTVKSIAPEAKETLSSLGVSQKRLEVTLTLNEKNPLLRPGMPLDVTIIVNEKKDALTIPSAIVFEDAQGKGVYIIKDNRAELVRVQTGVEHNNRIEILSGIEDSDLLILSPITEVKPNQKVRF